VPGWAKTLTIRNGLWLARSELAAHHAEHPTVLADRPEQPVRRVDRRESEPLLAPRAARFEPT